MNLKRNINRGLPIALLAMVAIVPAQEVTPAKSLGEVAREQKQAKKLDQNPAHKAYSEVGTAPTEITPEKTDSDQGTAKSTHRSVFDQAKSAKPDFIIIPAGTEIRVDIVESKVIAPVRVGFATPIPPLSIAAVKVSQNYYAPISYSVTNASGEPVVYGESAELISVTVGGVSYPVQAKRVALNGGATLGTAESISSSRDAVFVLTAPLPIAR